MAVSKESRRLDPLFPLWAVPEFAKSGAADENTLCPVVSGIHAPAAYGRGCGTYGGGRSHHTPVDSAVSESFRLYYRWDETVLDPGYLDNEANIKRILDHLQNSPRIDSITVYSYSSPEGAYAYNKRLAERRAATAKQFILDNVPDSVLSERNIRLCPIAENWDGLYEEAYAGYHRWDREWVLGTIRADVSPETKEWRFKNHDGGLAWRILMQRHMPKLRVATWVCVWTPLPETEAASEVVRPVPAVADVPESGLVHEPYTVVRPAGCPPVLKRTVVALKTNLLYDAVTALNFSVEVPVGDNFSIMAEDVFPWWTWGPHGNKYAFQMWELGLEPRWWFRKSDSRDRLAGHFVGLYGMVSKYDFQWDHLGCYQGEYWSAGLSYGYAMPLCEWLNMEFSLSVGYLESPYRHYVPDENYEVLWRDKFKTGTVRYFGPTQARISLVIPIACKYSPGGR